jgi:hypothetical protein
MSEGLDKVGASMYGNEPSPFSAVAEPDLSSRYEAPIGALKAAA